MTDPVTDALNGPPPGQGDLFDGVTVGIARGAAISDCRRYRFSLTRRWSMGPVCTFVMLNPSTADAEADDPTIRRCMQFAQREGCGALEVVNLFAYRATAPSQLEAAGWPVGPLNCRWVTGALIAATESHGPAIAAWGALARSAVAVSEQADWCRSIARHIGIDLQCLGRTKAGAPRHPLYLRKDAPCRPLEVAA